jgi:hypothetical protein
MLRRHGSPSAQRGWSVVESALAGPDLLHFGGAIVIGEKYDISEALAIVQPGPGESHLGLPRPSSRGIWCFFPGRSTRIVGGIEGSTICRHTAQTKKKLPEAHAYAHFVHAVQPACRLASGGGSKSTNMLRALDLVLRSGTAEPRRGLGGVPYEWGELGATRVPRQCRGWVGQVSGFPPCLRLTGSTNTAGGNIPWEFDLPGSLSVSFSM